MFFKIRYVTNVIYKHLLDITWPMVILVAAGHCVSSYILFSLAGETDLVVDKIDFFYFWVVTASTVGFGDMSPVATHLGKLVAALWFIPGALGVFGLTLGKITATVGFWIRKKAKGMADYSKLGGHTVVIGWQGEPSRRMILQLAADNHSDNTDIVLITRKDIENPMPDLVKFVRGESLTDDDVLDRAGVVTADKIIIYGEGDDQSLTVGLAVYAKTAEDGNHDEHIVIYFQNESVAKLFRKSCPTAEVFLSPSVEMLIRAVADPGSSRIANKLYDALNGPTQYSIVVPEGFTANFGHMFDYFKLEHNATLLGVAKSRSGDNLNLNPPMDSTISSGDVVYYMADHRVATWPISDADDVVG